MPRTTQAAGRRARLLAHDWLAGVPAEETEALLAQGREIALADGQFLYRKGDPSDGLYAILEGRVCVSAPAVNGREAILDFYAAGAWIGDVSAFEEGERYFDAFALGPVALLRVGTAQLEALLLRFPRLCRAFLRLEAKRLGIMLAAHTAFVTLTLEQRLAMRILMLAEVYGQREARGLRIDLHLSQEVQARLVGTTRQRVNQVLKRWEAKGLVEQRYGRLLLRDEGAVRAIVSVG